MSKKTGIIILVIALISLCASVVALCLTGIPAKQQSQDIQYVMYLGTNDKDTNEPVCGPDEAKAKAEEILIKHFGGYTIQEASGGWEDGGIRYKEYTLVIYISDTTLEKVHAAADDLIKDFRQSSILIQKNITGTEFYSGSNN